MVESILEIIIIFIHTQGTLLRLLQNRVQYNRKINNSDKISAKKKIKINNKTLSYEVWYLAKLSQAQLLNHLVYFIVSEIIIIHHILNVH